MLFLAEFSVIKLDPGLAFWTLLIFVILWVLLGKYAFKPIAQALEERSSSIDNALKQAEQARNEMANLKAENEKIMQQAREERAVMLKEAKDLATTMITDAKEKAKDETSRMVESAKLDISNMQKAAMTQVKNEVGTMAIQIAEKIIRKELAKDSAQVDFANALVNDMKLN
jgi:F-type H+-transporting ATPase subunit b